MRFHHFLLLLLLALISNAQAVHHRLTKRELQSVFGVEEKAHVPEYSLISTRRERTEDGRLLLSFDAWNKTYTLDLQPNKKLLSPHLVSVIREGNKTVERRGLDGLTSDCHWQGRVLSHGGLPAAVSDCGRLMGTLVLDDHFLVLQTLPKRAEEWQRSASLLTDNERTVREEQELVSVNEVGDSFCDTSESLDEPLAGLPAEILSLNYSVPSLGQLDSPFIFPQLDPITLEIGLFLDSKLYEHFQEEFSSRDAEQHLLDFSLALINNVHVLYQQPTLSPNLDIVIVRYELWKTQPRNLETLTHKNGQAQTLLDGFCRHQARINPGSDLTDPGHWDHGVLLTGYDIYHTTTSVAGVAPVARMCDELFACSLVEGLHLGRSFVLAHEMGHNMGMVHDGVQNQCSRSCCLMSAVNGAGKTTWSQCSVREFNAFLLQLDESGRGNCLRDASAGLHTHNHLSDGRLPGQRFTADQQCSYFWGRDYQVEIPTGRTMDDICRILWCGNSGSTISTAHPALEGSYCGDNRWCLEGRCRSWLLGAPPPVVHGGWSDWSSGEKRCPIAQCHVSGSITLRSQHRDCVNPAPNNGGRTCQGSALRGVVCGSADSSCRGLSRQEFSDRVCSSIRNDPNKPDRQLTGSSFQHSTQPCRVWCHLVGSELIRNKGQYPDGAPCGQNQYCIGGQCLSLSCGNTAAVERQEDCPGESRAAPPSSFWEEWQAWSSCSATCGRGTQRRKRSCHSDPFGLKPCDGAKEEERECQPSLPSCDAYSVWGLWTECDVVCGEGRRRRSRLCTSGNCAGPLEESETCQKGACPEWVAWAEWSACSVSCGGGERSRRRLCSLPGQCKGRDVEVEACASETCTEETWGDWLPCSASCGIGFQIRERLCNGRLCDSRNKEARTCNEQECPRAGVSRDYEWDSWSLWLPCSETCGEGFQLRTRKCRSGRCPDFEQSTERRRCVISPCPTWSGWTIWSYCPDCTSKNTRTRTRTCSSHLPPFKVAAHLCSGSPVEIETCETACKRRKDDKTHPNLIRALGTPIQPVDNWDKWADWQACSVTCGGGRRERTRACLAGEQQESCPPEEATQTEACNEQPCDSPWTAWGEWSSCSETCGPLGTRTRQRRCTAFFSFQCAGSAEENSPCVENPSCDELPEPSPTEIQVPAWSDWSDWSACSCFTLTATRRRFCAILDPAVQGFCAGGIVEQRPCAPLDCAPVGGGWSTWSQWSRCSRDCEGPPGHQIRTRACSAPLPANRGVYCSGYSFDQRVCRSSDSCQTKVDGAWSDWTEWSVCSDPCINGHRSRTRFCSDPRPSHGGLQCFGSDFELVPCNEPLLCNISDVIRQQAEWGQWTSWSACSATCGFSFQKRHRICESPKGSAPCEGDAHQTSVCEMPACTQSRDGGWTEWNEWSNCAGNCGVGSRLRTRECASPLPSDGGTPCFGRRSELVECRVSDPKLCLQFVTNGHAIDTEIAPLLALK